jgi:hypothetical protein
MAGTGHSSARQQDFIRAVLVELQRVTEQNRDAWTVKTSLPVVPHAAQLSLLGILLLKGVDSSHVEIYSCREKLEGLLGKAYQEAKKVWQEALTKTRPEARDKLLNDNKMIRPAVMKAVDFADQKFGLLDMPLGSFTGNVQDTLAELVGKVSEAIELKIRPGAKSGATGQVPGAVYGAVTVGMLAGGLVGRREMTPKELSAARIAVRLGSQKDEDGGPEAKEVRRLRKTLKELGLHLPEQRA